MGAITVTSDGLIYLLDGNRVVRIDTGTPTAALTASASPVVTGQEVTLDASGSTIPLSAVTRFQWDLDGDGQFDTDTGATPTADTSFQHAGLYTLHVRVTARSGKTATAAVVEDVRPAPPAGPVGVSVNGGALYTNDPHVLIHTVWPEFASTVTLSNDGGFAHAENQAVAADIPWTLDSSGPERLPKTVYVRFDEGTQTFQDDIILDEVPPVLTSATLIGPSAVGAKLQTRRAQASRSGEYTLRASASDDDSGVGTMQLAQQSRRGGPMQPYTSAEKIVAKAAFMRVADRAGNFSPWRRVSLLDVSVRSRRVEGNTPLVLKYSATTPTTLVTKVIRGTTLLRRKSFEVDRGPGTITLATNQLPAGRYKIRSLLQGITFETTITLLSPRTPRHPPR